MQGELFTAQVVSFPIDGRTVLIRRTARRLMELEHDKKTAAAFWTETCLKLKTQADMESFAESVTEEMRQIVCAEEAQSHA